MTTKRGLHMIGICILSLVSTSVSCRPRPMTAETLIADCAKAMGGADIIAALQTLRIEQIFPDHEGLLRCEIKRPNKIRLGEQLVFDGRRASWLLRTAADGTEQRPELVPQEEWKDFELDIAWFLPAFFDHPASYQGMETINGIETHRLQVTLPLGAVVTYNLNAETSLIHRISARFVIRDQEHRTERIFSDYRDIGGLLYPHAFTYQGREGVFTATIEKLEINLPLEDERFAVPPEVDK